MQDGTYLYQNGNYHPIRMTEGFWVAERELAPSELQDAMFEEDASSGEIMIETGMACDGKENLKELRDWGI